MTKSENKPNKAKLIKKTVIGVAIFVVAFIALTLIAEATVKSDNTGAVAAIFCSKIVLSSLLSFAIVRFVIK